MYVYVYVYVYVYIYICIYVCVYICVCVYYYIYIRAVNRLKYLIAINHMIFMRYLVINRTLLFPPDTFMVISFSGALRQALFYCV